MAPSEGSAMAIKVFLADDHALLRDSLQMLLEAEADIQVVGGAGDGREAVREAKRLCADVVLMDISMPNLDGIEATRQICQNCPGTGVVILSVSLSCEYVFKALRAGARGYVLKESSGIELVQAVRAVHSGLRYFGRAIMDIMVEDYMQLRQTVSTTSPLESLSSREREILQLLAEGLSNSEIATSLFLSVKSVETYRSRMMQKLGIHDFASLIKFAILHGITSLESRRS